MAIISWEKWQGSHEEILNFVDKYNARDKFTWFEKGHVNGAETREVYSFLKQRCPNKDGSTGITWNFAKFLVDHEGNPYSRSSASPQDLVTDIEELLKKKEGP